MNRLLIVVIVGAALAMAPSAAQAVPVKEAKVGLQVAVTKELVAVAPGLATDAYKSSCKRRSSKTFRCAFRAVIIDGVWEGRGTVTYLGRRGYWRYSLKGHTEGCGPNGCRKDGTFRWKGVTGD